MRERIKDGERIKHIIEAMNVIIENKDKHSFEEVVSDKIVLFGFVKQSTASAQVRLLLLQDIWKYVILFVFLHTILKTSTYGDDYTDIRRILKQGHATP
ncbi:MAG: hypothetical protein MJZ33_09725 [Paludibacteraceae bacterium]|nr:hypothetical protein [Paludibacteraceae bacterium]